MTLRDLLQSVELELPRNRDGKVPLADQLAQTFGILESQLLPLGKGRV